MTRRLPFYSLLAVLSGLIYFHAGYAQSRATGSQAAPAEQCPETVAHFQAVQWYPNSCGSQTPPYAIDASVQSMEGAWNIEVISESESSYWIGALSKGFIGVGLREPDGDWGLIGEFRTYLASPVEVTSGSLVTAFIDGDGAEALRVGGAANTGFLTGQHSRGDQVSTANWRKLPPPRVGAVEFDSNRRDADGEPVLSTLQLDGSVDEQGVGRIELNHPVSCGAGMRGNCTSLYVTVYGENLAQPAPVWLDPNSHMELLDTSFLFGDNESYSTDFAMKWMVTGEPETQAVRFRFVIWDGAKPGRYVLWYGDTPIPFDLVINGYIGECDPLAEDVQINNGPLNLTLNLKRPLEPGGNPDADYCHYVGTNAVESAIEIAALTDSDVDAKYRVPLRALDVSLYKKREDSDAAGPLYRDVQLRWDDGDGEVIFDRWGFNFSAQSINLLLDTDDDNSLGVAAGELNFTMDDSAEIHLGGPLYLANEARGRLSYRWERESRGIDDGTWRFDGLNSMVLEVRRSGDVPSSARMRLDFDANGRVEAEMDLAESQTWEACGISFVLNRSSLVARADVHTEQIDIVSGQLEGLIRTTGFIESEQRFALAWQDGELRFVNEGMGSKSFTDQSCSAD